MNLIRLFTPAALFVAASVLMPSASGASELRRVTSETPPLTSAFEAVEEGDRVVLDISLALERSVLSQFGYEGFEEVVEADEGDLVAGCPFGPLSPLSDVVQVPTGDTHFLLSMRFGDPHSHAANLASCEYRPGGEVAQTVLRLRGCFLALTLSIPTARHILLHPLPASDCREPQ